MPLDTKFGFFTILASCKGDLLSPSENLIFCGAGAGAGGQAFNGGIMFCLLFFLTLLCLGQFYIFFLSEGKGLKATQ